MMRLPLITPSGDATGRRIRSGYVGNAIKFESELASPKHESPPPVAVPKVWHPLMPIP
jgi:hypothetical protein